VEQWESIVKQWKLFAEEEGFQVLHKRELEHHEKGSDFEWPELSKAEKDEKKKRINQRACQIILDHVLAGIGLIVQKSEWERSVTKDAGSWSNEIGRSFLRGGCLWLRHVPSFTNIFSSARNLRFYEVQYVYS